LVPLSRGLLAIHVKTSKEGIWALGRLDAQSLVLPNSLPRRNQKHYLQTLSSVYTIQYTFGAHGNQRTVGALRQNVKLFKSGDKAFAVQERISIPLPCLSMLYLNNGLSVLVQLNKDCIFIPPIGSLFNSCMLVR
jgi:hypothetical protein